MHDYGTKIIVGDFNAYQLCSFAEYYENRHLSYFYIENDDYLEEEQLWAAGLKWIYSLYIRLTKTALIDPGNAWEH